MQTKRSLGRPLTEQKDSVLYHTAQISIALLDRAMTKGVQEISVWQSCINTMAITFLYKWQVVPELGSPVGTCRVPALPLLV